MEQDRQSKMLIQLVTMRMPYGKYKGTLLCDLPEPYLSWYQAKGFLKDKWDSFWPLFMKSNSMGLSIYSSPLKRNARSVNFVQIQRITVINNSYLGTSDNAHGNLNEHLCLNIYVE